MSEFVPRAVLCLALIYSGPSSLALAEDGDSTTEIPNSGILVGSSPFGGSLTFSRHTSRQTTWQFSVGGNPETDFQVQVDDVDYDMVTNSSWVGFFVNYRPLPQADWFRVVSGIAIGNIKHQLRDGDGNRFLAEYNESPVAYMGMGIGSAAKRGLTLGFDIGWLQSAGPKISFHSGPEASEAGGLSPSEQRDRLDAFDDDFFFGTFLPNIQVGVGYNF